ncbi:class I SAM-dependent methyltransferase [Massilia sp. CCM 8734]|uniref:methyltransferase domain-containing protein n=1 Tax=Massilia sp. CCM 8734 TaxID=2609283 RepID=UPI0014231C9A|nr:class I SAM-dependent methyltransferase [Massilia sp. CCM 8734]NHZ99226.1 methyltransferase domain-containing protein [Massilia sp. CCM 8734]
MTTPARSCRACGAPLHHSFADLGLSPVSNAFVEPDQAAEGEMFYPLHAMVCAGCWLVQLADATRAELHFHANYVYFSSFSSSWLAHARAYVEQMTARLGLNGSSRVMEIASNDGYLLQYFQQAGIACIGIEPSGNTAAAARARGIDTRELFFNRATASALAAQGEQVDLLLGNNVLAHVPDLHDFVGAMPAVMKRQAVATLEFPHLLRLIADQQFDTIYHEHYAYLSLTALMPVFARAGLRVFDIEHLTTHGGSLRVHACLPGAAHATTAQVAACLEQEQAAGLMRLDTYTGFGERMRATKRALQRFLIDAKDQGKTIAAYGAAAKGNTLLNYCGIGADIIDYVVDSNPAKQGKLLPGSRIPVRAPHAVFETRPDYLLILPWNIKDELMGQMAGIRDWGGQFLLANPHIQVVA